MASYIAAKPFFDGSKRYEKGDPVEYAGEAGANLVPVGEVKAQFAVEEPTPERTGFDPVAVARAPGTATGGEVSSLLDDEPAPAPDLANDDDALVAGSLATIVPTLAGKTDAELDALEAAEKDREAPRSGLLNAIAKERDARA